MIDLLWQQFFICCRQTLGAGASDPAFSSSWCAYTTFSSLKHGVYYFNSGFPEEKDCGDKEIADGSIWRQSIAYSDLAHIVIPSVFYWEQVSDGNFTCGYKQQGLGSLSAKLVQHGITHRLTEQIIEIKLY